MNKKLRDHADRIVREAIAAVQPDAAVQRALAGRKFPGRVLCASLSTTFPLTSKAK